MSISEESTEAIESVAYETVELLAAVAVPADMGRDEAMSALALRRLAVLLGAELRASDGDRDLLLLYARAVLETWLTGHTALLLGEDGRERLERRRRLLVALADPRATGDMSWPEPPVTLSELARRLDLHVYGVPGPKAFQRHLRSFFEEIDVSGAEVTEVVLDAHLRCANEGALESGARADVVRVSLWVVLFLARYFFDATGQPERAGKAYELFLRLRDAAAAVSRQRPRG